MYSISKEYEFSYAHRVWAQCLSNGQTPTCRRLHGHTAKIIISLDAEKLQGHDVVLDYNELKPFKKWVDENLDHRTILDINDPLLEKMGIPKFRDPLESIPFFWSFHKGEDEYLSSFVFMEGIPTSENLAKLLYQVARIIIPGAPISSVVFMESSTSLARYWPS